MAVDIETRGLDATKYVTGCLIKDKTPNKAEIYDNKKELWRRIIQLGEQERRRQKTLQVYSHNAQYDFYSYADLTHKGLKIHSHKPFIASLTIRGKETIKFLDTYSIYRTSLEKIGYLLNQPKGQTPLELIQGKEISKKNLKRIKEYMQQDTRICLGCIERTKKILAEDLGSTPKRLITINQIAIGVLTNWLRRHPEHHHIFWNQKTGEIRRTLRDTEIRAAYRGGRCEAFQTGQHTNCTYIDCNSLYPYSATQIIFPDLATERKTWKPLTQHKTREWLAMYPIGISRAIVINHNNTLGLLPIRTNEGNTYPPPNTILIGTWTHQELAKSLNEGYEIRHIEWTVHYEPAKTNPIKEFMLEMYRKRCENTEPLHNYLYKSIMNSCLGKLAQCRQNQEITISDVEDAPEKLEKGYKIIRGIDYNYMYQKAPEPGQNKKKRYYCPIIPTLINAQARIIMYDALKKIPRKNLLYTDTDSIIWKERNDLLKNYKISKELGDFKIVHERKPILIYGKKTYMIGEEIHISGMHTKGITPEDFKKGTVTDKKMITIQETTNLEEAGKFRTDTRNLKEQKEKKEERKREESQIYIDSDIQDITEMINQIQEAMSTTFKEQTQKTYKAKKERVLQTQD